MEKRFKGHLRDASRRDYPVYNWINSRLSDNIKIGITVIACANADGWCEVESDIIKQYREYGRLLNVADGGNQPSCPPYVRASNAKHAAKTRNKRLWFLKRALGDSLKRGFVSEETKDGMRSLAVINPKQFGEWANI